MLAQCLQMLQRYLLVDKALLTMLEDEGSLTTLKPRVDLVAGLCTLHTTTSRLAIAGRGTTTSADALVVGTLVVREAGENRGAPGLHRQRGEEGDERWLLWRHLEGPSAALRRLRKR